MPALTDVERKWITDLTGDGSGKPGPIDEESKNDYEISAEKEKLIDQMVAALDLVRDEIAEGERYELIIKGFFRDKKVKSVEKVTKTFDEVEMKEDIKKAQALSQAQQKKIFEAHQKAVAVKDIMTKARKKDKDGKDTEAPLFTDEEITEEFWTPVMRERLLPDNAIPARFSAVQKTFQASAQLYKDRLDEIEAESGSREELAKMLGVSQQAIAAAGQLAVAIETLIPVKTPDVAEKIQTITKGIQIGLMAGVGIAKGALEKSGDGIVDSMSKLIATTVGGATGNNALGTIVASGFKAAAKGPVIAKHLSRGKEGIPDALASLGDAIDAAMTAADTDSTKGSWAMTGKLIAGAFRAQKGLTPVIVKAIGDGKAPDVNEIIRGFTKAAASAFGVYMEVKRDFDNEAIKKEAEEVKHKAEEAKTEAQLAKNEAHHAKAEAGEKHIEAENAKTEAAAAAKEAQQAKREAEEARTEAAEAAKAAKEAMEKADQKHTPEAAKAAAEAATLSAEAAHKSFEASAKAHEASTKATEAAAKKDEAVKAEKEGREEAVKAEREAKEKEEEAKKAEKEADEAKEKADKECDENSEKVIEAEELLEWATEEEGEPKGKKKKSPKEKKENFEKELKARGLDMEKLKAATTTPEAMKALEAKVEEMEKVAAHDKIKEKSEEFKALLEDSMKADGEAAESAQELRSVERLILQMEADKKILETFNMVVDTVATVADQLVPGLRAISAGKDFILAVIAAAERACQFNMFCDRLSDAQNSLSPYAEPIKNRVKNSKVQLEQKTILAILKAAQVAGAISACTGVGAAGLAVEKAATLTEKGMEIAIKIQTKREMAAQWKIFQEAFDDPDNRRLGKKALKGNPTLSKYAIAYGAITANDANARAVANKCGLNDETLAHEETNVDIVVKYLEVKFEDDPKLYKPIPSVPKWAPKGSEIGLTMESWTIMKQAAIDKGGMNKDHPTGAIDGAFTKLAKAKKEFDAKKKKETLTDADLKACTDALEALKSALQKFEPLSKKNEPLDAVKDYAKDLLILVKQEGDQFEIDFLVSNAEHAKKADASAHAAPDAVKTASTHSTATASASTQAAKPSAADAAAPKAPAGVHFFKQGGDNLCAYYALNHFNNRDLGKDTFLTKARQFYQRTVKASADDADKLVNDGNDPALLTDFGLAEKGFGASDAYIVAGVGKGHFWVIRKAGDTWWTYDGLQAGPTPLGDDAAATKHVAGKKLYA